MAYNPGEEKKPKLSDELKNALKSVIDEFNNEDTSIRERQIRMCKKLEYYWAGYQNIYYDGTARDFRIWNNDLGQGVGLDEAAYYDKPMNVFRALLETVIAALSVTTPGIKATPDDADNPLDISTAEGASKIAQILFKYVDAPLLWSKALFVFMTQGMMAAYNYSVESEKFGTVDVDEYEDETEIIEHLTCPNCDAPLAKSNKEEFQDFNFEQDPDLVLSDLEKENENNQELDENGMQPIICRNCNTEVIPKVTKQEIIVPKFTGVGKKPKARQKIDVNGQLFVKVPSYARTQEDTPYLRYSYETHYSNVLKKYDHLRKEFYKDGKYTFDTSTQPDMDYERWGRLNVQYLGEYPRNTPTVDNWWLRPNCYYMIPDEKLRNEAFRNFPKGIKLVYVNDCYADCAHEDLDEHWTLAYNPLADYISFDPWGLLATSVQEITNDLISLNLQTIEHGVPITFVDPKMVDLEGYRNSEVSPGSLYPAKVKPGEKMQDKIYTTTTAALGREVDPFSSRVEKLGQFVTGAMPSLFGSTGPSNERTAGQAELARSQALQRLKNPWQVINFWWKNTWAKVIPAYIKTMLEDERLVTQQNGTYVNDIIELTELQGKIGEIEVESSDELPQTWAQVREAIMNLLAAGNPMVLSVLGDPANIGIIQDSLGIPQFELPGAKDRKKQYYEIKELLQSGPIQTGDIGPDGQPVLMPTVEPEGVVDDHVIHVAICKDWLVSEAGLLAKVKNQAGYANVVAHLKAHLMMANPLPPDGEPNKQNNNQDKPAVPKNARTDVR